MIRWLLWEEWFQWHPHSVPFQSSEEEHQATVHESVEITPFANGQGRACRLHEHVFYLHLFHVWPNDDWGIWRFGWGILLLEWIYSIVWNSISIDLRLGRFVLPTISTEKEREEDIAEGFKVFVEVYYQVFIEVLTHQISALSLAYYSGIKRQKSQNKT